MLKLRPLLINLIKMNTHTHSFLFNNRGHHHETHHTRAHHNSNHSHKKDNKFSNNNNSNVNFNFNSNVNSHATPSKSTGKKGLSYIDKLRGKGLENNSEEKSLPKKLLESFLMSKYKEMEYVKLRKDYDDEGKTLTQIQLI